MVVVSLDEIRDQRSQDAGRCVLGSADIFAFYRVRLTNKLFPILLEDVLEVLGCCREALVSVA
jgi:hypothetical protein